MKTNELMIGDWVKVIHSDGSSDYEIVSQVGTQEIKTRDKNGYLQLYTKSKFEPIPLTEEILKTNGFEVYTHRGYSFISTYKDWHLTIAKSEIGRTYVRSAHNWVCDCNYVHELQNALRICGLNDLADNFKIE